MALLMGGAMAFFLVAMPIELIASAALPVEANARALVAGAAALVSAALTWAAITLAGKMDRSRHRRRPAFVEEELPIHLPDEGYAEFPVPRPIFASELGAPDTPGGNVPKPGVLKLVDVITEEQPVAHSEPIEPLAIAALMARLEAGVGRRAAKPVAPPSPIAPIPQAAVDDGGTLRNALDDLKKMAMR